MQEKNCFTSRLDVKAFTLIELLVVVLIIGILAAVALPQYQKAVIKSRLTQTLVYVKALHDGAEMYYLANGFYPNDVREVDLDITAGAEIKQSEFFTSMNIPAAFFPDGTECVIIGIAYVACSNPNNFYVEHTFNHGANAIDGGVGKLSCCGESNTQGDLVCRTSANKTTRDWVNGNTNHNCYFLN